MSDDFNHPVWTIFRYQPLLLQKIGDDRPLHLVYYGRMRKFSDTLVLVVSSFVGVLLFVRGNTPLFVLTLVLQYIAFISYATRIRETTLKASPFIFNFGYAVVLTAYVLSCYLFKQMVFG